MGDSPLAARFDRTNLWELAGPGPVFAQLADGIRAAVMDGRLRAGDALPPTRALAAEAGVSRWVVVEAYEQLKAEGYLTAHPGSSTRVAAVPAAQPAAAPQQPSAAARPRFDLSPSSPDLAAFPRRAWALAYAHALRTAPHTRLGYPDTAGVPEFREAVASYLRRVRGMRVDAADVQVTPGTSVALQLLFRVLAASGRRRIALEDPCWPRAADTAADCGLTILPVSVDGAGIDLDRLVRTGVDAVHLTPAHQFPTGAVLSPERRTRLLRWAAERDVVIVEDDYDAELRYDRRPVGALAALAPDRVAHLGSTSKALAPTLRLGWMVVPPALRPAVSEQADRLRSAPSNLDQLAFAHLLRTGGYDRHLRARKRAYNTTRQALVDALRRAVPDAPIDEPAAGLHVVVGLPPGVPEAIVVERATAAGMAVTGITSCRVVPDDAAGALLVGFGRLSGTDIPTVVGLLAGVIDESRPRPSR